MTDVNGLIDQLIDREGGYVNDPSDPGGETNFGITALEARRQGYAGPMRDLPRAEAADIYRRKYWLGPRFVLLAPIYPRVAAELFDTGVNMGPATAATFLQRILNVFGMEAGEVDGKIGTETVAALGRFAAQRGAAGETVLLRALDALQGERYVAICENNPAEDKFLFGWLDKRLGNA